MFVVDGGMSDFEASAEPVRQVLQRIEAEVVSLKPWDERRLAYPLGGRKRGLYVLTYFKAEPERMGEIQHEIQLSEKILRALLLSADHVSAEQMDAETPATLARARKAASEAQKAARAKAKARKEETGGAAEAEKAEGKAPEPSGAGGESAGGEGEGDKAKSGRKAEKKPEADETKA